MAKRHILVQCIPILALIFSGCSTISQPKDPSESWTPPGWAEKKLSKDTTWETLRQREINGEEGLDLAELLDIALTNNPTTREAWENARAAHAKIKQAESKWYPQVSVSSKTQFSKKVTNNDAGNLNQADYSALGQAEMLLMDFGGRAARVSSAKQTLLEANFNFNQAIQDVFLDTATAYYGLYSARFMVEAAEADVADSKASLTDARQRYTAGLVSKLDVLQAEPTYQDSLYSLEDAKGNLKTARGKLAQVLGVPADTGFEIAEPVNDIPSDITKENVSALIEKGLEKRPSIAAAKASVASKEADLAAANSDLWPTLNTGGDMGAAKHRFFGSEKNESVFNYKSEYGYDAFLSVEWNIFDGFYLYSKRNEAKALAAAERQKLAQAELAASTEVWTKYFNYKTAEKKYVYGKAFFETSKTSYELASDSYRAGLKSILDLLQAQSQLSSARSKLITSKESLFVSLAELAHSIGALTVEGKDQGR